MTKKAIYKVKITCANCRKTQEVEIPIGMAVAEYGFITPCHYCGCKDTRYVARD